MPLHLLMLGYKNLFEMLSKKDLKSEKGTVSYSAELAKALGSGEHTCLSTLVSEVRIVRASGADTFHSSAKRRRDYMNSKNWIGW